MTLYTVDGLLEALEWANSGVAADTNACLWLAYLRWLGTPGRAAAGRPRRSSRRAGSTATTCSGTAAHPGNACLSGLATGEMGTVYRPVNPDSKGCGTVMRSAPFGLIPYIPADAVYKLSADAASLTHGHPSARQSAGSVQPADPCPGQRRGPARSGRRPRSSQLQEGRLPKGEDPDPARRPAGRRPCGWPGRRPPAAPAACWPGGTGAGTRRGVGGGGGTRRRALRRAGHRAGADGGGRAARRSTSGRRSPWP